MRNTTHTDRTALLTISRMPQFISKPFGEGTKLGVESRSNMPNREVGRWAGWIPSSHIHRRCSFRPFAVATRQRSGSVPGCYGSGTCWSWPREVNTPAGLQSVALRPDPSRAPPVRPRPGSRFRGDRPPRSSGWTRSPAPPCPPLRWGRRDAPSPCHGPRAIIKSQSPPAHPWAPTPRTALHGASKCLWRPMRRAVRLGSDGPPRWRNEPVRGP
mmetsp:Transcript_64769/g.115174  ORF Transcript_64769/g.115174 Transcript_64769/m.115174 type:complete len:214 (-) Transcript_64769:55-696(-)